MMTRKQKKAHNLQLRLAAEKRKRQEKKAGTNQRIPKDLSGPERWALVDSINKPKQETNNSKGVTAQIIQLANKYYSKPALKDDDGTVLSDAVSFRTQSDLQQLKPYQLDKIIGWATWSEDKGKAESRKAEMRMRKNLKFKTKNSYNHSTMRPTS